MEKFQSFLMYAGLIVLGLPALLRSLVLFFKLIPGDEPDLVLEKILGFSDKAAELYGKLFPQQSK